MCWGVYTRPAPPRILPLADLGAGERPPERRRRAQPQVPPSQPPTTTLHETDLPMFFFLAWIFALRYSGIPATESGYPA